ncbi:tyrosine-type recombinase/integrase [Streptomyces sp. NPDC058735]|uniref:tyrosine-type recombinase/integrase n=1 Tax=unclassified Streptomyces TaxID=2593676 RepID=UPI0036780502
MRRSSSRWSRHEHQDRSHRRSTPHSRTRPRRRVRAPRLGRHRDRPGKSAHQPPTQRPAAHPLTSPAASAASSHKAAIRTLRFHDLRHSPATLLLEKGVELVVTKKLLRHARIGVTATVYAHVRRRLQPDAVDALITALGVPSREVVDG